MSERFAVTHVILPALTLLVALCGVALFGIDLHFADRFFTGGRWLGADTWWANDLLHTGGRNLVLTIALAALFATLWRRVRRQAAFVFLGIALSTGAVAALKHITDIDCPWHLTRYGGDRPYVSLLAPRPSHLPRAACFPGAHSSSGFSLMAFYFLLRDRSRRAARLALAGGALLGALFAFGQEARGAHFMSHDLTSAAVVWYVLLATYLAVRVPRWAPHRNNVRLIPPDSAVLPVPVRPRMPP